MPTWMKLFEREYDECMETGHKDFRCFLSSEPPKNDPFADIIP
jgi:hypothetical protein